MLAGPIPATEMALKKAGMGMQDIDLFEVRHLSFYKGIGGNQTPLRIIFEEHKI
jgi:hypothetical protein